MHIKFNGVPIFCNYFPELGFLSSVWIINSSIKLGYYSRTSLPNNFIIPIKSFCESSFHFDFNLVGHIL